MITYTTATTTVYPMITFPTATNHNSINYDNLHNSNYNIKSNDNLPYSKSITNDKLSHQLQPNIQ